MPIKTWRMTAVAVAFTVWFAYSVPVGATTPISGNNLLTGSVMQTDDDDDDMSGGALAVLLLAIGGAVAGVLYSAQSSGTTNSVDLNLVPGKIAKVSMDGTDVGKQKRISWNATLDKTSGTITLTKDGTDGAGRPVRSQWMGKVDGKYYPVTGDPTANEFSFTKVDAQTLGFSARKAGRVVLTGRIVVSVKGRSYTIRTNRTDLTGRRTNRQRVYAAR